MLDDLVARGLQTPDLLIVDGAAGLEAQIMADGMLVGFVPKIPGSESWTTEQTVEAIATAVYD